MPCTEAQKRGNAAYNRRQDNIMIRPPKPEGAMIRAAAAAGQPVQAYIRQDCKERMQRNGFNMTVSANQADTPDS